MGKLGDELARLRAQIEAGQGLHKLPPEVDLVLALAERERARGEGRPVPPFSQAQLEELYRQDVEDTGPAMEKWRAAPGWASEESQHRLDEVEEDARARLRELSEGASLAEVYEDIDDDEEEC